MLTATSGTVWSSDSVTNRPLPRENVSMGISIQITNAGCLKRSRRVRLGAGDMIALGRQRGLELILDFALSMHEPDRTKSGRGILDRRPPRSQLRTVRMGAVAVDNLNVGQERHLVAEDSKNRLPLDDTPA